MEEIWKDIKGFEGLYQISNLGNVKSLRCWRKQENYIMKLQPNSTRQDGFASSEVSRCCNHKRKNLYKGFAWTFATDYRKEDIDNLLEEWK